MLAYCLEPTCTVVLADDAATIESPRGPLRVTSLAAGQVAVLARLGEQVPCRREDLVRLAGEDDPALGPWVHMIVDRLVALGFLARVVGSPPLARLTSMAPGSSPARAPLPPTARVRLDPLALLRAQSGDIVLESPRSTSRVTLLDPSVAAVLAGLASPATVKDAVRDTGLDPDAVSTLICELHAEGFIVEEGDAPSWPEWSFHDALFHARSRSGLHDYPYGATYRQEGVRPFLPAVKPRSEGEIVELATIDLEDAARTDPPFAQVLESRQSWRVPGERALHVDELGEFLWRSARVRGRRGTEHEEVSNRPYPGGGADYELEIYVLAHRVQGLERGLFHYDPLDHVLVTVSGWTPSAELLAQDVAGKTATGQVPDVALLITARMHRLTYKYESIPYAVALKDLGALYGTWYLTATAMGLAPCALGGGDGRVLSEALGIPAWIEPRIGEFLLNTPDPGERRGALPPPRVERHRRETSSGSLGDE